jgi:hypothetical protein
MAQMASNSIPETGGPFPSESRKSPEVDSEPPDFRTAMLRRYMPEGRLLAWPARFKRQYIIIEEIARRFEPGVEYSESEVDELLKSIYPLDHCTLRRYLVDLRFVHRANGIYRR